MTSSRFILIFLGFIFLIIIILSSGRISAALQKRFGNIIPSMKLYSKPTPTPAPAPLTSILPTPTTIYNQDTTSSPTGEIPATGPEIISLFILSGSLITGISLKNLSHFKEK